MSFAVPAFLWLLVAPVALFLLQSLAQGERATATLELWRLLRASAADGAPRPRPDWSRAWLPLALALVVLASAGPRVGSVESRWQVHIDLRPQMLLEEGGATRLESALSACEGWLAARGAQADWRVEGAIVDSGARLDRRVLPGRLRHAGRFDAPDAEDALWVVDRLPAPPRQAWAFVAARTPRPGLVERRFEDGLVLDRAWDGAEARLVAAGGPASSVVHDPDLPRVLVDFVRAWAADRGLVARERGPGEDETVLEVRLAPAGASRAISFDDEGASLVGVARTTLADIPLARRLQRHDGVVLSASEPGIVWLAFSELRLSGSPEAFGARLARFMDEARLSCTGCASIEGRSGSGEAFVVEPARAPATEGLELQWLCLLGALACLWPAWRRG
ncbi:MAG: hypothetical protein RL112_2086 [Planctomycetota bacterium]